MNLSQLFASDIQLLIAQALGIVSFALGISTFYQKNDRRLKIVLLTLNLNHTLHFLLLGSTISAVGTLLSASRTATSIYTSSKFVTLLFVSAGVAMGLLFADSLWHIWPIMGTVLGTIAVFQFKGIPMRVVFLAASSCWLVNNIHIGSIGGVMLEVTVTSVNLLTIARLYLQKPQRA